MDPIRQHKNVKSRVFATGALCLLLAACTHHEQAAAPRDDKFVVTDTLLNSLNIDTVRQAGSQSEITLTGEISADEDKMVKIFPMVSGLVQNVRVQLGDVVKKGQQLANMKSIEMAGFAKDVIAAQADSRNTLRSLQTTQDLYKSGLASEKDLEQAKGDYQKAQAEQKRSSSVMQIDRGNSSNGYVISSPISGYVVEKNLTNNMQVRADNTQNLFTIADLSNVWVMINIYESDISSVQTGDEVQITTLSYPDKVFTGKIDKIYNMLDPDNKVIRARVVIKNPDFLLKPQMFANVKIQSKSGEKLPFINTNDLIFDNNRNYVLVVEGKAKVRIQPVEIENRTEGRAFISKGLNAGDRIIASRQLFLYESLKD